MASARTGKGFKVVDLSDQYDVDQSELGQVGAGSVVASGINLELLNAGLADGYEVAGVIQRAQSEDTVGEGVPAWVGPFVILRQA